MKKLIVMIAAAAMIFSFLPKAEATGAQLGVTVTFNLGYPEEIDVLAKAVYHHAFDINQDGIINGLDAEFVNRAYQLANQHQVYLPDELFAILDVNGNRYIDDLDEMYVQMEVRVYCIATDFAQLRGKADEVYYDAVESGDPDVIQLAITHLREYHGDEVKPRIAELQQIAEEREDLHELIDGVLEKGFGLLRRIDDYIMRLMDLLNPLNICSRPEGPLEVMEGKKLEFQVLAWDNDTGNVTLEPIGLPEGAKWYPDEYPGDANDRTGRVEWTPYIGQAQDLPYVAVFEATNAQGQIKKLEIVITVLAAQIHIEVRPPTWDLTGVRLGDVRENVTPDGNIMHVVINTGDVDVMLDIAYAPYEQLGIIPGETQGTNTFTTAIADESNILLPGKWLTVGRIPVTSVQQLHVFYGAPTKVSEGIQGHRVTYELRATGDIN